MPRPVAESIVLTILLFVSLSLASSAAAVEQRTPLTPFKTDIPPVIDGVLDDAVWKQAPQETGFKTYNPDYGKDMREKTIVYYAYDRENLYFAYRCYDSEPDKVKASIAARDTIRPDDWVCLNLDTFNDQQSLYALYVNPLGIQADSKFEGNQEDFTVDVVWYSAGKINPEGYAVEIRIPFKSIRYGRREPVAMGIIFERYISRLTESGTMPPLDPAQGPNFLTQGRTLLFSDIKHYTLLEALPAVTYGRQSGLDAGELKAAPGEASVSLTAKYGLSSQLILDATVNPDFSQVEADAGQVDFNQRYALYYPEKRPFFLEGREKYTLAANLDGDPLGAVVHTRMIVNPLVGFKLDGKLAPRDTIASIYAMDELPPGSASTYSHFTIARYKHALSEDSYVGGFWTGRFEGSRHNILAGGDGQIRLSPSSYFAYHALVSQTSPGGDSSETEGHAVGLEYYYATRNAILDIAAQDLGRDFETETGYLTRNGLTRIKAGFAPLFYPKSKTILRVVPMVHIIQIRDKFSGLWETTEQFDLRFTLPRTTQLAVGTRYATEIFLGKKFGRSNVKFTASSQLSKRLRLSCGYAYGQKIRYVDNPYQGRGNDASASVTFLPSENLNFSLNFTYSDFTRSADSVQEYDYTIIRSLNTYQVNRYLFFRAIIEHNSFRRRLMTDFLASFTYIPGTVIHIGYGSLYEKLEWRDEAYLPSDRFLESKRGFFFKASYLWRL